MLSKRTFSPVKSSSAAEDDIDSPFGKQAKLNNVDGPGKNYFEFVNNTMKEERESDEESVLPNKEEDLSEAFNKARNYLMNFLQLTQKIKERNFLSQKELKTKFKVNFTAFPNTDEILKIFNKILKRLTLAKTQKRNWYQEDIVLLLWVVRKYCCYKNKHPDNLLEEDWNTISDMIPVKSADQCKFKFLTLKKVDLYKYPWTKEEDKYLKQIMTEKGMAKIKWGDIAKQLNSSTQSSIFRSGKLCRERWNNYLNPDLKKCEWSADEDTELMRMVLNMGKKWSEISKLLPGRNENAVKNRFFSLLRKEKKRQNLSKSQNDGTNASDYEGFSNSEEVGLINSILADRNVSTINKKENESSIQEIKLRNLTNSMENIRINTISRLGNLPHEIHEPKPINIKRESLEESKTPSPPLSTPQNQQNPNTNPTASKNIPLNQFPQSSNSISSNPFHPQQSFGSNPFLCPDNKSGNYFSNIIFQNIPKLIQMNNFGYFNPYFPNQPQAQMSPYDSFKFGSYQSPRYPDPTPQNNMPDIDKVDNVLFNHPIFQSQQKVESTLYNQTPHTLKNNLDLKRDPPSFSTHPLVENANEKQEIINNSIESLPNVEGGMNQIFQPQTQNSTQFNNLNNPSSRVVGDMPANIGDVTMKFKIKNGLELSPADYSACLYSVVNIAKRELFLFTPLSNPSESNKSFLSAFFNLAPSQNDSPQDDYISFNSGSRSLTKNEIPVNNNNNSFRKIKKNKTCNSLVSSQHSSNNLSNNIINNTCLSNSPPHSPKKDSKFKEKEKNYCFPNE